MDLSVSGQTSASVYSAANKAKDDTDAMSRKDLLAALNSALPGLSVAFGRLPSDEKEQEKLARSGQLAPITIEPKAAERMQNDPSYRDEMIALIKKDHEEWGPGTIHDMGNSKSEVIAHGISINDDGSTSSWTFSKTVEDDSDKNSDKKGLLDRMKGKLKEQLDKGKLSKERYEAAISQAEAMRAQGKSEEEIVAALRQAFLSTLGPGDDPSVGIEKKI